MEGQASEDLCKERCRKLIDELEDTVAAFEAVEQPLKQSITKVYISVSDSEPNRARSLEAIRQSVAAELDIDALRRGVKTLTRASQVETPRNPDCPEDFIADRRRLDLTALLDHARDCTGDSDMRTGDGRSARRRLAGGFEHEQRLVDGAANVLRELSLCRRTRAHFDFLRVNPISPQR